MATTANTSGIIYSDGTIQTTAGGIDNDSAYLTNVPWTAVPSDIIPDGNNTRNLGSPTNQWQHIYVSTGSIYLGNVKLSTNNGKLEFG